MPAEGMMSKTHTHHHDEFFRCPVTGESASGTLRVGRRRIPVQIQETAIDGFTILVPAKHTQKLKAESSWILSYDGSEIEVHPQWFIHSPKGETQVSLRRLRDVTPVPDVGSWWNSIKPSRSNGMSDPVVAYAGVAMILFITMATPGIGDHLGTSDRIEGAVKWIAEGLQREWKTWF
jgi:hypothetical protein